MNSSSTFTIGGDIEVRRLGFGAMRITGPGVWGPPSDRAAALALLRRAVELGVQLIDTADAYGPGVSEELIAEGLHPYDGLLIATKGGYERTGPSGRSDTGELLGWRPNGRPDHLRSGCEGSLRRLRVDRIDLYQLHTPDPAVPFAESIGALEELRSEGKIRRIGISNVTLEQLAVARAATAVSTVQNQLDLTDQRWRQMLTECESHGIGFIPYRPIRAWDDDPVLKQLLTPAAARHDATPDQIALAWLLGLSPVTLPIPGTVTRAHLEDNVAAASLDLDDDEIDAITTAVMSSLARPERDDQEGGEPALSAGTSFTGPNW
jgi:aryl-alcohol dehydrogenase-like predicted oxidoreductase